MSEIRPGLRGVRRAMEADLPAILRLVNSCEEAPEWTEAAWGAFAGTGENEGLRRLLLLAESLEGELCGLLAATFLPGESELESVLVARNVRRRGVGTALLSAWLAWAEQEGATTVLLEVRATNTGALALYHSLGFAVQGRRPGYYREPIEEAILMGRRFGPGAVEVRAGVRSGKV